MKRSPLLFAAVLFFLDLLPAQAQFPEVADVSASPREILEAQGDVPQPAINVLPNTFFKLTLYDPITQKTAGSDNLCLFADSEEATSGTWQSAKNTDLEGVWVQWANEIWIWGADRSDLLYQISLTGRFFKEKEIYGRFTILDFDDPSEWGGFRLKQGNFNKCSKLL